MSRLSRIFAVVALLVLSACSGPADAAKHRTALERAHNATVLIDFTDGTCSGTVIGPRTILSATHCFTHGGYVEVQVDGHRVTVMKHIEDGNDHTIIWVDRTLGTPAPIRLTPPQVGDDVRIWGNPGVMRDVLRKGTMVGTSPAGDGKTQIQLYDMNVYLGDSGAGVFDEDGRLVGVVTGLFNFTDGFSPSYAKLTAVLPFNFTATEWASAVP